MMDADKKFRHRRRQFIVKKEFQLRYIGLILAIMFMSMAVSGWTIYYNTWALLGGKLADVYPQGRLVHIFRSINIRLAINMFFIAMLCTGIAILASHKIAGPVYRMIKFLDGTREGDYSQRITLRKGDELQDLAEAINRFMEKIDKQKNT